MGAMSICCIYVGFTERCLFHFYNIFIAISNEFSYYWYVLTADSGHGLIEFDDDDDC